MTEQRESSPRIAEDDANVDEELSRMQAQLAQMEAEKNLTAQNFSQGMVEDPSLVDARSVYIGNVDYGATPEEIQAHFQACGIINRVTILCDKFSGHPKGYAYVEFAEPATVQNALVLNDSMFRGRLISVKEKRTNIPGMNMTNRGRGRGRGGFGFRGGFRPYRGRGRGRGRGW